MKKLQILILFLIPFTLYGQVKINEASNTNGSTLILPDGDSPDWIELYNAGSSPVNLSGYKLSDDPDDYKKWIFPSVIIQPKSYITVFATGSQTKYITEHYETSVFADSIWQYFIPNAEVPNWNKPTFNSSSWLKGPASIGFGDGDDATDVIGPFTTIYSRIPFQCTNINAISEAILDIDYDDGFVAYLNGVEITRWGLYTTPPRWNEFSDDHEASLYLGGRITPFYLDLVTVKSALVIGTNVLAIEIHNSGFDSSDLTCKPYLTFGYSSPGTYASGIVHPSFVPSGGGRLEANFKISSTGETIYLSDPANNLIDTLRVLDLEPNMSNGKFPDGSTNSVVFAVPTPKLSNNSSSYFGGFEKKPSIVNVGGVYTGSTLTVSVINNSVSGGVLRYTTNGNNPDTSSPLITGPLVLNSNCVLKVTCFPVGTNLLPSIIETETFLFSENFELPIVLLTIDSVHLYGANGIFDNWWTDWKRPCVVEYFDKNGVKQFESRSSVKPDGGAGGSRSHPQHSVTIEPSNSIFGEGKPIQYPIIPEKPHIKDYYALYIRNGSNNWNKYPQKDAMFMRMMRNTNANSSAYTPAVVFLNGNYFGVYELREKANEGYFENNYGNDRDSLDLLSISYFYGAGLLRTVKGHDSSFYSMKNFIKTSNPLSPSYFDNCHKKLDLYNFTDYMAGENWFANFDWIFNNMKMARTRTFDNKWRFFLLDLENGLGGWTNHNANMFEWFQNYPNTNPFGEIYNGLIQNPEFKNYYINRYADLMNTVFQEKQYKPIVLSMHNELLADYPRSLLRWRGNANMSTYIVTYNNILALFANRNRVVRGQIVNHFNLAGSVNVSLDVFPEGAGYIKISTIVPEELPWQGVYFNGNPVKITAVANPGYTFQAWDANATIPTNSLTNASVKYNISSNDLFRAVFTGSPQPLSLTISEINYNPDPSVDGGNWIELHNFGNVAIDLTAWYIKSKNHWDKFTFEDQTILNPGAYLVVCQDTALFKSIYPQVSNVVGGTGFSWSNQWDSVKLFNPIDSLIFAARYSDALPFPKCADGWGRTLENKNVSQLPSDSTSWFCGCIGGSPGEAYSPCEEPIIVSEFNYNNSNSIYDAGDWIELYNNTSDTINLESYVFKDSKNDNIYTLPAISIAPDSFIVLSNDLSLFSGRHPLVRNVLGEFDFGLSSNDGIRIYNNKGTIINSFVYNTLAPWSSIPSDSDYTNEYNFYNGYLDQNNGLSWFVGCIGGSPGTKYISCSVSVGEQPLDDLDRFVSLYPNPAKDYVNIKTSKTIEKVTLFNLLGQEVLSKEVHAQYFNIDISSLIPGHYYAKLTSNGQSQTIKLLKF